MKHLHTIEFTHYSQKDSADGISAYVIVFFEEQVVQHLAVDLLVSWEDWERDEDAAMVEPIDSWWAENPDALKRAAALDLTVHFRDWGERAGEPDVVEGKKTDVCRWFREDPTEVSNLYYGATTIRWSEGTPITDEDAAVLVRLGIAIELPPLEVTP